MSEISDRLIAAELRAGLKGCRIGNEIVVVEETPSTNDLAWEAVERGTPEGFVVLKESRARVDTVPSIHPYLVALREDLLHDGVLEQQADHLVFVKPHAFNGSVALTDRTVAVRVAR